MVHDVSRSLTHGSLPGIKRSWYRSPLVASYEFVIVNQAKNSGFNRQQTRTTTGEIFFSHPKKREKLGIPAFGLKPWTKPEIALIETVSYPEVGHRLGRPAFCVQTKRERLGIPAFLSVGNRQSLRCSTPTQTGTLQGFSTERKLR